MLAKKGDEVRIQPERKQASFGVLTFNFQRGGENLRVLGLSYLLPMSRFRLVVGPAIVSGRNAPRMPLRAPASPAQSCPGGRQAAERAARRAHGRRKGGKAPLRAR